MYVFIIQITHIHARLTQKIKSTTVLKVLIVNSQEKIE